MNRPKLHGTPKATEMINSFRQFEVALLFYDKGPMRASEVKAHGALLDRMARRGLIESVPSDHWLPAMWKLTTAGRSETLRFRRTYKDWLANRPGAVRPPWRSTEHSRPRP